MAQTLSWASVSDTQNASIQESITNFDSSWFSMEEEERSNDIFSEDTSLSWMSQEHDLPWIDQLPTVIGDDYMGINEDKEYDLFRTISCDSGYEDEPGCDSRSEDVMNIMNFMDYLIHGYDTIHGDKDSYNLDSIPPGLSHQLHDLQMVHKDDKFTLKREDRRLQCKI